MIEPGIHSTDRSEFYTPERVHISEWHNTEADAGCSVAQCRVGVGVTTQLHSLAVAERYLISSGQGQMELNREPSFPVKVGDVVIIPPDCPQRIRNTGGVDLIFLCVCTPRFQVHDYTNLEDESTPLPDL